MGFTYNVKLPGFNNRIFQAREINGALYRTIVKSLYNADDTAFIQCINNAIEYIIPGILQEDINVVDKLLLLINTRTICVSPDLKLRVTCPVTKKEFNYTCRLDEIYEQLEKLEYTRTITVENIEVTHSIIKAQHEAVFFDAKNNEALLPFYQLASAVDKIVIDGNTILFKGIPLESRVQIIESLPLSVSQALFVSLNEVESSLADKKLLYVISPMSGQPAVNMPVSTNVNSLLRVCKFIFTDDLTNLYRMVFNLVNYVGFSADYLDNIAPAEQLLYWSYYLQTQQKEDTGVSTLNKVAGFPRDVPTSRSEFG